MRIIKILRADQDLIARFVAVLGSGLAVAAQNKTTRSGFFVFASNFIHEYLEPVYFRKEEVLLSALEDCGFSPDDGPVGNMHSGHQKSRELSRILSEAARQWQGGDSAGRTEAIWAASEYTGVMRQHFDLMRNLIHPLLEQSLSLEGEEKVAEGLNLIAFEEPSSDLPDKYLKMVETLEEEVANWKK
jgi:hemerythrin-like domain-containing protein